MRDPVAPQRELLREQVALVPFGFIREAKTKPGETRILLGENTSCPPATRVPGFSGKTGAGPGGSNGLAFNQQILPTHSHAAEEAQRSCR